MRKRYDRLLSFINCLTVDYLFNYESRLPAHKKRSILNEHSKKSIEKCIAIEKKTVENYGFRCVNFTVMHFYSQTLIESPFKKNTIENLHSN